MCGGQMGGGSNGGGQMWGANWLVGELSSWNVAVKCSGCQMGGGVKCGGSHVRGSNVG